MIEMGRSGLLDRASSLPTVSSSLRCEFYIDHVDSAFCSRVGVNNVITAVACRGASYSYVDIAQHA